MLRGIAEDCYGEVPTTIRSIFPDMAAKMVDACVTEKQQYANLDPNFAWEIAKISGQNIANMVIAATSGDIGASEAAAENELALWTAVTQELTDEQSISDAIDTTARERLIQSNVRYTLPPTKPIPKTTTKPGTSKPAMSIPGGSLPWPTILLGAAGLAAMVYFFRKPKLA